MFIVTTRRTFLAADEPGAITVVKYRHVQVGEPALNQRLHMTQGEAKDFLRMQAEGKTEAHDNVAGRDTTYTITDD